MLLVHPVFVRFLILFVTHSVVFVCTRAWCCCWLGCVVCRILTKCPRASATKLFLSRVQARRVAQARRRLLIRYNHCDFWTVVRFSNICLIYIITNRCHTNKKIQIHEALDQYAYVYVFSVENMRNSKLKDVRTAWKDSRSLHMILLVLMSQYVMQNRGCIYDA
jgi:predicted transposase YbfD/YdcC